MISLLLPVLADAAPAPDTTRVTISLAAQVAPESSTYGAAASDSNSSGARGNGTAEVTVYAWEPLVDDASPRSLQAFLQRTSTLQLDAGGQYLSVSYSPAAKGGSYAQDYVPASASTRIFVLPSLAILAGAGASYLHDQRSPLVGNVTSRNLWEPWGSVGLDLRSGDASLALQWQVAGVDETATGMSVSAPGVFWPRLSLAGRIVADRWVDVTASVGVIPDGVEARAGLALYPTKDLGLSLFAQVEHGQIYWDSTTDYTSVFGGPAISYWLSGRAELSLSYAPTWVSWAQSTEWQHPITLRFTARVP